MRTLLRNARLPGTDATSVAVEGDRIAWVGVDDAAWSGADEVVDVAGGLLTPAFVDAHVHTVRTGFARATGRWPGEDPAVSDS